MSFMNKKINIIRGGGEILVTVWQFDAKLIYIFHGMRKKLIKSWTIW